jgi:hypothetical protein
LKVALLLSVINEDLFLFYLLEALTRLDQECFFVFLLVPETFGNSRNFQRRLKLVKNKEIWLMIEYSQRFLLWLVQIYVNFWG